MRNLALAATAVALTAAAAPAFAQDLDELVITGHGRNPPPSLTERVSFDDLDLRAAPDRAVLRHRVVKTAQRVCRLLGEQIAPVSPSLRANSCEGVATTNAMRQVRVAIRQAYDRPAYAYNDWIGVRAGF